MYIREKAVEYAEKWALKRNPKYYDFEHLGGDCTNFISQCLFAGGIEPSYKNFGWFYHSLVSRSPSWTGVDELFDFATNNSHIYGPKLALSTINNLEIGDIIQLNVRGYWSHTLIITKMLLPKSELNTYICSHSFDALNKSLKTYRYNDIRFLKVLN